MNTKVTSVFDPENPREWDGNLSTICITENKYFPGDKQDIIDFDAFDSLADVDKYLERQGYFHAPVNAYIHSAIRLGMSSGYPFNCRFDAVRAGVIITHKSKIRERFGCKYVTKAIRDKVLKCFAGELEAYENYLNGWIEEYDPEDCDPNTDEPQETQNQN